MRLKAGLPKTDFAPARGYGLASVPYVGPQDLPVSVFQTLDEVKAARDLAYEAGRIFLGRVDGHMVGVKDDRHVVTIAGSRSGKSACLLIPNLKLYPGSMLVIDPKGELATLTAGHRHDVLGQNVAILDPFGMVRGDAVRFVKHHDPLRELDADGPDIVDDAAALAEALVLDTGGDKHWTISARNLLTSLILLSKFSAESPTLSDLRALLARDPAFVWEAMAGFSPDDAQTPVRRDAYSLLEGQGLSFLHKNPNEAASIISSALEQLTFAQSPALGAMFKGHDVALEDLKTTPDGKATTLYVVLPANRMETHNRWLRALVTLALLHYERLPTDRSKLPIVLVLEEFAALGHLRPVEQAAGFIAGSGVRLWSVLQDITQLQRHYPEGWQTFLANAGILHAFSASDLATCEYLSKRLGETTVEITNKQSVSESQKHSGDAGERREFRTLPLLSPTELAIEFARTVNDDGTPSGLTVVISPGLHPFVVDRVFWGNLA